MINLEKEIAESLKAKKVFDLKMYRLILSEKQILEATKGFTEYTEASEAALLGKMIKQRLKSRDAYLEAGNEKLANIEVEEINFLKKFLPEVASKTLINAAITEWMKENPGYTPKDTSRAVSYVKSKVTGANGKDVFLCVKERLSNQA